MKIMWRDTGRTVRFFGVDGKAMLLLLLVLYNPAIWTLVVAAAGITLLIVLERAGYTIPNALRKVGVWFVGRHRPAVIRSRRGRSDR
jgi:hypothetical protein